MTLSTKTSGELTLHDRLSRLNYLHASKLLGEEGGKLIQKGGALDIDIAEQVELTPDRFRLTLPGSSDRGTGLSAAVVTIERAADARDYLRWECSACDRACEHVGAAFSLVLEDKMALGLAAPPVERIPLESLSDDKLIETGPHRKGRTVPLGENDSPVHAARTALD